ncbi:nuclease-related domain-containing protein [Neobacillus niacini]|uniref:nuclease-related domain-containing protein n=1 Tax=Neobacillus niacini TaxID=86668 RepID=UPI0007AB81FC|nr:nuclease-related domain-containing protein [Neobacillus niacini]MEC1524782.1 nuclease-related domain-containing protein [Neobacillus niacini]
MILRSRRESDELLKMRSLNTRMELTQEERLHYFNLEKGYEGEVQFDRKAEVIQEERYFINDLLLKINNSYFQIDSTLISQEVIRLIDVKNFEGDFCLDKDRFFLVKTGREYKNPINQLNKCAAQFRQLLQDLKLNYLVEATIIFINPEFTLYNAQVDHPIILPTQVNRFFKSINDTSSKLNDGHKKLAQQLLSLHQTTNPFTQVPNYQYDQLKKDMYCKFCRSFLVSLQTHHFVCGKCGGHETIEAAILRNVKEFQLLFPERKITTTNIYEWCNVDLTKRTFCRVLKKNLSSFGKTSDSYFI